MLFFSIIQWLSESECESRQLEAASMVKAKAVGFFSTEAKGKVRSAFETKNIWRGLAFQFGSFFIFAQFVHFCPFLSHLLPVDFR